MSNHKTIKVTRTFVHTTRATYPDAYPGVGTPSQAAILEENRDVESAIESLYHDPDGDALTMTTVVEVEDYEE